MIVLGLFAPWSVYLPDAIARLRFWQRSEWCKQLRQAQLSIFALFWFISIFVFFSISVTKLPSYVLPLIPAAAILVTLAWSAEFTPLPQSKLNYGLLISIVANLLLAIILATAFIYSPNFIGNDPAVPDFAEKVAQSGLPWRGGLVWGLTAVAIAWLMVKYRTLCLFYPNIGTNLFELR